MTALVLDGHDAAAHARRRRLIRIAGYTAMLVALAIIVLPLLWIALTSFKTRGEVYTQPVTWWPGSLYAGNYTDATSLIPFWTFLRNSLLITTVLGTLKFVLGILTAYALVFLRFPGKTLVFLTVIAALMVPNQITIISNYALVAELGWRNTFQGIIIPLAGVALGTFLMRNHFLSIPAEIIEAARMDGAGHATLLWRVILPASRPTMVAFALITLVNEWNEYLWPFLIADDYRVAPIPVGLTFLQNNEGLTNWGPVMAGTILAAIPILIVFIILQKQMIKGLTSGAVKG